MKMQRLSRWLAASTLGLILAGFGASASADVILFDFEEQAEGTFSSVTSTQSGLTATITRQDGGNFTITNLNGSPPSFQTRSIGNFEGPFVDPGSTLIINFSQAVNAASISFGDFNADDDSPVTLTAFSGLDGTGSTIDSASVDYPADLDFSNGDSAVRTLSVSGGSILSLTFTSASSNDFPGSLYSDNLTVTTGSPSVPEPSSLVLVGLGVVGLVAARKRVAAR